MIQQSDTIDSMPKAFIFNKGEATIHAFPLNDNRSSPGSSRWRSPIMWCLVGGALLGLLFIGLS